MFGSGIRSHFPVLLVALPAGLCAAGWALADESSKFKSGSGINPVGQPADVKQGQKSQYAVWYEKGAWNVQVTAKDKDNKSDRFDGAIYINGGGKIVRGEFEGLEAGQKAKKGKKAKPPDLIWLSSDERTLEFRLTSSGKTDRFSFRVTPLATTIEFKLLVGGGEYPDLIRIGKAGVRPEKVPFVLDAHPKE